jgi:hypothetical protein
MFCSLFGFKAGQVLRNVVRSGTSTDALKYNTVKVFCGVHVALNGDMTGHELGAMIKPQNRHAMRLVLLLFHCVSIASSSCLLLSASHRLSRYHNHTSPYVPTS